MARSLKIRQDSIDTVKRALIQKGSRQSDLAQELAISQSTVSQFLNGRPVDYQKFIRISQELGWAEEQWKEIADLGFAEGEQVGSFTATNQNMSKIAAVTSWEYPKGQVPLGSPLYMERPPIEDRCYEAISKPNALIRIKAPRQMGKSSLLSRIQNRAEGQGDRAVYLDLQLTEREFFQNTDTFLKWFCAAVANELQLPDNLDEYWGRAKIVGSKVAFRDYFERYLLPTVNQPITLCLDEVDCVFEFEHIYNSFFSLLRALHEGGKRKGLLEKLRLVIVHSTEAYIPLDLNQSPFNVGLSIELPEFTEAQVQDLARRHDLLWGISEVQSLMKLVGGQPFLVRLALYHIARQDITLPDLLQTAATETGIYQEYLRHIRSILDEKLDMAVAVREIANAAPMPVRVDKITQYRLRSLGLVVLHGEDLTPSCELYRQYFRLDRNPHLEEGFVLT